MTQSTMGLFVIGLYPAYRQAKMCIGPLAKYLAHDSSLWAAVDK